jgi:ABC-2 type transport system ATP-binding protein
LKHESRKLETELDFMSLQINQLTKVYGQQYAVNNVSFSVESGEILGFLGPNGAGKSTTMKIATGYLPPTAGSVFVGGYNVSENPRAAQQIIGYLPEHNPLYLDLYVHEYLSFVGNIYGLSGKRLKHRVGEMIEMCGLNREQNKKIETLSKGYRQRVGLAQALLHDPKILVLDEPTSGLDPNQLVEIRKLISEVSKDKTVIFSTHIMQEVQALCDRVVVINRGEIVANDSLSNLMQQHNAQSIVVEFEHPVAITLLQSLPGVEEVISLSEKSFRLRTKEDIDVRSEVFRLAAEKQLALIGLKVDAHSLEHVFQTLTSEKVSV